MKKMQWNTVSKNENTVNNYNFKKIIIRLITHPGE